MSNLLKSESINIDSVKVVYNDVYSGGASCLYSKKGYVDSETKAKFIIESAKKDAEKLLSDAEREKFDVLTAAREQGYKEGFEKASAEVFNEYKTALDEIKNIVERLDAGKEKYIFENKRNIIDISFSIAEKIMNQRLSLEDEAFLKIYEKAVKDLTAKKWLKLTISKYEKEIVTNSSDYLLGMVSGAERLEVQVLDNAPRGTCIVETTDKIVDASVCTQFDMLKETVLKN